jgi:hypothetical protein
MIRCDELDFAVRQIESETTTARQSRRSLNLVQANAEISGYGVDELGLADVTEKTECARLLFAQAQKIKFIRRSTAC